MTAPAPAPVPAPAPASAPSPAPAPAPAPAAAPEAKTVPYDRFASKVAQYQEAASELATLRQSLAAAQEQIGTLEKKVVRADVRVATGVDDDDMAGLLHARYRTAVEGQEEPPELSAWWEKIKGDEEARAALPLGLRAYAAPVEAPAPAPAPARGTRLRGATPPRPGRAQMTAADFAAMGEKEQAAAMSAFFGGRRLA